MKTKRSSWYGDTLIEPDPGVRDPDPLPTPSPTTDDLPIILYDADERPLRRRIGFTSKALLRK